jgi:CRISPR-associated DxTHG motif protein
MTHHLISFLGTSAYKECCYTNEQFSHQTAYSSVAVAHYIESIVEAASTTKATVFVTPSAERLNADNLRAAWSPHAELSFRSISESGDENGYWSIFQTINETVQDDEIVWLDITHSFRYLPLLAYAVLQYLRDVRHMTIGGIYYGAAETLGPPAQWPAIASDRRVPLHDLSAFLQVNQWSNALSTFNESGVATDIRKLTDTKALPLVKTSKGKDQQAQALKQLGIALETWSQQAQTCRGGAMIATTIGDRIDDFIAAIGHDMIPPLSAEFTKLQQQFSQLKKGKVENIFIAAEWCAQKGLIQQTWTLLQEGIVTYFADRWGAELNEAFPMPSNQKPASAAKRIFIQRREFVSQLFQVSGIGIQPREWKEPLGRSPALGQQLQDEIPAGLAKLYINIAADRNDINHAGFDQNAADHKKIAQRAHDNLAAVRAAIPKAFG